ncbi:hypothetical protein GCM10009552_28910 [Rothia nasimurium]|uniref:Uncharacterized protein n=1 Tax=Luteibacter anthropi TaxID=564369 RepID=A0A7X5UAH8_9GAMM|nr:hypothetical protein [Luteibacter anthropi]NII06915.1 hypothetical protein [Luteibacter anthropi]
MATESVIDVFPSVIYDIYRAKGKGLRKMADDPHARNLARAFATTFIREREKDFKKTSGTSPKGASVVDQRMMGNRVLSHADLMAQYSAMRPDDWVAIATAAFYHGRSQKHLTDKLRASEKPVNDGQNCDEKGDYAAKTVPWRVDLIERGLARRGTTSDAREGA